MGQSRIIYENETRYFKYDIDVTNSGNVENLLSSAYQLTLSQNGIANVYAYKNSSDFASINVTDGGGFAGASNVDEKNYSVKYYNASGSVIKESKDPFNDGGTLTKSQLPGKVVVSYRKNSSSPFQTITLTVKEIGSYEIKINTN